MTAIDVYDDADLPDHLGWQIVSFDRVEWADEVDDALPWGPRAYPPDRGARYVVATEGRVLLGAAVVVRERARVGEAVLAIAGLGSVFVFPNRRRAGLGRTLVARADALIDATDADLAMLFCLPVHVAFYERAGWVLATSATIVEPDASVWPDRHMIRPLSPKARGLGQRLLTEPVYVDSPW